ncbi:MAG: endonuclease [Flavobacteriales bacterium]|nr:endonuclease [Flavobacteriales bacterium]
MLRIRFDLIGLGLVFAFGLVREELHAQSNAELSVCTFNVRYDNPNDTIKWNERKNDVALAMRYFDIVSVQEVLPNQYEDLSAMLPEHEAFGIGRDADGKGEACPVYWNAERFDFLQGETRWLSLKSNQPGSVGWDADLPRIATVVVLFDRKRQQIVRIINTHWSHVGEEARLNAAALVAGWSGWDGVTSDELVVVCGDLNSEPQTEAIQNLMASANLTDTYDAARYRCRQSFGTYTTFLPENLANATRIDYILYRGLATVDWVCADEVLKYGVYISDHMPYHAIFK